MPTAGRSPLLVLRESPGRLSCHWTSGCAVSVLLLTDPVQFSAFDETPLETRPGNKWRWKIMDQLIVHISGKQRWYCLSLCSSFAFSARSCILFYQPWMLLKIVFYPCHDCPSGLRWKQWRHSWSSEGADSQILFVDLQIFWSKRLSFLILILP